MSEAGAVPRIVGHDALIAAATAAPLELPVTAFYFVRHGRTAGNRARVFQGADEPLDAIGIAQAEAAARAAAPLGLRHIAASPTTRTRQTAARIVEQTGVAAVACHDGLRERDFGALIGTSSRDLDWAALPPDGESLGDFAARVRLAVAEALDRPSPTLIVAHGGTLLVLAAALGVPVHGLAGNGRLLRFARDGQGWTAAAVAAAAADAAGFV